LYPCDCKKSRRAGFARRPHRLRFAALRSNFTEHIILRLLGAKGMFGVLCRTVYSARRCLVFAAAVTLPWAAAAQTMRLPTVEAVAIDWPSTLADFEPHRPLIDTARAQGQLGLADRARIALLKLRFQALRDADLQAAVNHLVGERFANAVLSPTPVLLPFDVARYLRDRLSANGAGPTADYLNGFTALKYFKPGPAGYDASFNMPAAEVAKIPGVTARGDVAVTMSGSSLFYVLSDPSPPTGVIDGRFPDLSPNVRRVIHDRALRFTFDRYGAPYLVSIDCRPQDASGDLISCAEADKVGERFLKSLRLAGGAPSRLTLGTTAPNTIDRPRCADRAFTYHAPGDLMTGSGYQGNGGKADYTVYARMSSPIAAERSYANSQVFMHGGECLSNPPASIQTVPEPQAKGDSYHCKRNPSKLLTFFEGAQENYAYPWRDNFCESRDWPLGQCPGNNGHQGQDIRPSKCYPVSDSSPRCQPYRHRINAVRDGIVQREKGREALYLVVNTATEHLRFRYLHMNPAYLDRDGMVTGRVLSEGERIGLMGTFLDGHERGTTYHLHFDVQVPTRDGWLYVSPYMTLVAAHERHIGGFGKEIKSDGTVAGPTSGARCR
jgi:hypothetical protein